MIHHPDYSLNLNDILMAYYSQIKTVPTMRFGQYFMNIAFSSVQDSTLFYETDIQKALNRIYDLYAYPDGVLHKISW